MSEESNLSASTQPLIPVAVRRVAPRVLIVDDDLALLVATSELLAGDGFVATTASSAEEALERLRTQTFHLVLCDLQLPGKSGIALLKIIHDASPSTASVLVTAHGSIRTAVTALKRGAVEYMSKPVKPRRLLTLCRALTADPAEFVPSTLLVGESTRLTSFEGMVARSHAMRSVFERIDVAARTGDTVLLVGETGTGKGLAARAVHRHSSRAGAPFVSFSAGGLGHDEQAGLLFGREGDGDSASPGRLDQASGGTLFIEDVAELDLGTQQRLLGFLEKRTFTRLGGTRDCEADVRVIASAHENLEALVARGVLRNDLAYRLSGFAIQLPALRERAEDIPALAAALLDELAARYHREAVALPAQTQRLLAAYSWPGNVRELRNVIEQALLRAHSGSLDASLLPRMLGEEPRREELIKIRVGTPINLVEREVILRTLEAHQGNKTAAAETLGISRRSIYNKLAEYGEPSV